MMSQELFSGEFCTISYDQDQQIITIKWHEKTSTLDEQEFKDNIAHLLLLIEAYKPSNLLINAQQFLFTIDPELQEWYQENVIPRYIEANISKISIVKTQDFFTNLAIEQMFEKAKLSNQLMVNHSKDINEANNWFNEQGLPA